MVKGKNNFDFFLKKNIPACIGMVYTQAMSKNLYDRQTPPLSKAFSKTEINTLCFFLFILVWHTQRIRNSSEIAFSHHYHHKLPPATKTVN